MTSEKTLHTMIDGVAVRQGRATDASALAHLICMAMTEPCCAYFYGEGNTQAEFVEMMTELCLRDDTQYSYRNALVAEVEGRVGGLALSYDGAQLHDLRRAFVAAVQERFGRDFSAMADETGAGELYLDSFAVEPDCRRRGIGHRLLRATQEKAHQLGIPKVGLLVDDGNPSALRLYLSAGFKEVDRNTWGGHAMKHLQLDA